MHGRNPLTVAWAALSLTCALAGCGPTPSPPEDAPAPPAELATRFDPASAGAVEGRVSWQGGLPTVPPFSHRMLTWSAEPARQAALRRNPHTPAIDPATRGVKGAVVFLRGADPARSRPWDHEPVRVEFRDYLLHVCQGESDGLVGFVRRGEAVEVVSRQPVFHSLHARGAAFFALPFPDPDQPLRRRLEKAGVVELTSGTGHFWMRGHLFVCDHPYCTRTDAAGRFVLRQVPPGSYEVVCWLPNWREERSERDPESGLVARVVFGRPAEVVRPVALGRGETRAVRFTLSAADFQFQSAR